MVVQPNTSEPITQQFTCNATGAPHLKIVWKHKDRLIQRNDDKYSIETDGASTNSPLMALQSVLTITNPELIDSGPITCEAITSYRQDSGDTANEGSLVMTSVRSRSNLVVLGELHTMFVCVLIIF